MTKNRIFIFLTSKNFILLRFFRYKREGYGNDGGRTKAIPTRRTTCFAVRQQSATGIGLERCPCHSEAQRGI